MGTTQSAVGKKELDLSINTYGALSSEGTLKYRTLLGIIGSVGIFAGLSISCRFLPVVRVPVASAQAPQNRTIVYSIWPHPELPSPRIDVGMDIPVSEGEQEITLQMPVWSPGDYHVQDHGRYVQNLHISALTGSDQAHELKVRHTDSSTWTVQVQNAGHLTVKYSLPETPPGLFSENIKMSPHFAFCNGPALLLYAAGHKDWKTQIQAYLPRGWKMEMPLPTVTEAKETPQSTAYVAPDYDTLADSPILMADAQGMTVRTFEVDHIPHRVAIFREPQAIDDVNDYVSLLKRVVQTENQIMGGPPYTQYEFFLDVSDVGGGLEHLNSSRILLHPGGMPSFFASLFAHEFFHLWNVKRIRPEPLGPFDYIHPPHTHNLWFAEGVTEYYAHVAVRRAGISGEEEFLNHWRQAIRTLQSNPARKRVTADEASMRVWEAGDSEGYGGLSYYEKGALIGLCLDLKIRNVTGGAKSLDDMMRLLMKRHNPPLPGYGEDELRATLNEITGHDLSDFYNLLARSTREMPFAECLGYAGLDVNLHPLPDATPEQVSLRRKWMAVLPEGSGITASHP